MATSASYYLGIIASRKTAHTKRIIAGGGGEGVAHDGRGQLLAGDLGGVPGGHVGRRLDLGRGAQGGGHGAWGRGH